MKHTKVQVGVRVFARSATRPGVEPEPVKSQRKHHAAQDEGRRAGVPVLQCAIRAGRHNRLHRDRRDEVQLLLGAAAPSRGRPTVGAVDGTAASGVADDDRRGLCGTARA